MVTSIQDIGILNYGTPPTGVNVTHPFLGKIVLQKISGSGPMIAAAKVLVPTAKASPSNPLNNSYPGAVNASAFPSLKVYGKRSASVGLTANVKASWLNATLIESLLLATDTAGQTDYFSVLLDDNYNPRSYDYSRCTHLSLYQSGSGGPVMCEMGFLTRFGDNELHWLIANGGVLPDGETVVDVPLSGYTGFAPDAGLLDDVSTVDFGSPSTASLVRSWRLNLLRGQGYADFQDGSPWPKDIATGMFGGTLMIEQSPVAGAIVPGTTMTIRLHTRFIGSVSYPKGLSINLALSQDTQQMDEDISMGNMVRTYTLADLASGGCPVTVTDI